MEKCQLSEFLTVAVLTLCADLQKISCHMTMNASNKRREEEISTVFNRVFESQLASGLHDSCQRALRTQSKS